MTFTKRFDGFGPEAFAAFEQKKWSSNMYNLERMAVRDLLLALGSALEGHLKASRPLSWQVTAHVPTIFNSRKVSEMVLYFCRSEADKKAILPLLDRRLSLPEQISDAAEHHRYVTLGVLINNAEVRVGLMMHSTAWLDVMNLLSRCRNSFERSIFLDLVHDLPDGSEAEIGPGNLVLARDFDVVHLNALEDAVLNETFVIFFGKRFGAGSDDVRTPLFARTCREVLLKALPLYEFIVWRPASDFVGVAQETKKVREAVESGVIDLRVGTLVKVMEGPFADRVGVVTEVDHKGLVRVLIGKVTIRTQGKLVRPVSPTNDRHR